MVLNPRVGQKVFLNKHGLRHIYGTDKGLSFLFRKALIITWVAPVKGTDNYFELEVDDEEISQFMVDNYCFDRC